MVGVVNYAAPFTVRGNKVAEAAARVDMDTLRLTKTGVQSSFNYIGYGDAAMCPAAQNTNLLSAYRSLIVSFEMRVNPNGASPFGDRTRLWLGRLATDASANPNNYASLETFYYSLDTTGQRNTVRAECICCCMGACTCHRSACLTTGLHTQPPAHALAGPCQAPSPLASSLTCHDSKPAALPACVCVP